MTDRRLTAVAATAALVIVSVTGVGSAHASFSVQATGDPQSAATATLVPVTGAEARRDASGIATVAWTAPAVRADLPANYIVRRSIGAAPSSAITPSVATGAAGDEFSDDLTTSATAHSAQISAMSSGVVFTCAIADGAAYCWGNGGIGQLGNGAVGIENKTLVPIAVDATGALKGKTITAISAGKDHACAIADGAAYCWGNGSRGKIGNGKLTPQTVPTAVKTSGVLAGKTVTAIDAGEEHTCAVADGAAYCWGWADSGRLGDNTTSGQVAEPMAVDTSGVLAGKTVTAISVGAAHSCAIADGAVYCWGKGSFGQLGNGTTVGSPVPVAVDAPAAWGASAVSMISVGAEHSCVVVDAAAYCWGNGSVGRLGDGSVTTRTKPVAVSTSGALADRAVTDVSASTSFTCVIADDWPYCWGSGQLGRGDVTASILPGAVVRTPELVGAGATIISAGFNHSCAFTTQGLYCWGNTPGNGAETPTSSPGAVTGELTSHTCAAGWLLTAAHRCAPGAGVSVQYTIDYTKAGWSPAAPTTVTADWEP